MDQRIEQKLAELDELLKERAEVEVRIAAFFGIEADEVLPHAAEPAATAEDSNRPATIPSRREPKESRPWVEHQTGAKRQRGEPCAECGSKGWRHFKTCPQNGAYTRHVVGEDSATVSNGRTILDAPEKIAEVDWIEIKAAYEDGDSFDMMKLSYPHYDPMELRRAVKADTYQAYHD